MKTNKYMKRSTLMTVCAILCLGFSPVSFADTQEILLIGQDKLDTRIESRNDLEIVSPERLPLDISTPLEEAGLGPQPEPPDMPSRVKDPAEMTGISPQPEPPTLPSTYENPVEKAGINPQPEPPGDPMSGTPMPIPPSSPTRVMNPSETGGINPQPEPPRDRYFMSLYKENASGEGENIR